MTNCKCDAPLREGESECDKCLLRKYLLITGGNTLPLRKRFSVYSIAKALRRAETAWKNGGCHDVEEFYPPDEEAGDDE